MLATLYDLAFIDEKFENLKVLKHEKNAKLHVHF